MLPSKIQITVDNWFNSEYSTLDFDKEDRYIPKETFYCTTCHTRKDLVLLSSKTRPLRCMSCQQIREKTLCSLKLRNSSMRNG